MLYENLDKNSYIRSAVDNMRRAKKFEEATLGPSEISYRLACYTKAIGMLYDEGIKKYETFDDVKKLVFEIARIINGGNRLIRNDGGLTTEVVETALDHFAKELLERLNSPTEYDLVETIALIEYRLRYTKPFYEKADRRISEALAAFFLMRSHRMLPEYVAWDRMKDARCQLPPADDPHLSIQELSKNIGELRNEPYFAAWVEAFRAQFRQSKQLQDETPPEPPKNPWEVRCRLALEHESTVYDPKNVTRSREEIDQLREATGKNAEDVVVFLPERMALHETIAAVVTKIQMIDPVVFLNQFIMNDDGLFKQIILPAVNVEVNIATFNETKKLFEQYVDYVIDDHFHMLNPNMEMRDILKDARETIEERIEIEDEKERYNPRLVESRIVLHKLVSDDLLRKYYNSKIRKIVDDEIESYLEDKSQRRLPMKPNSRRTVWVTAGGAASGKSSLVQLIRRERKQFGGTGPLCQVNPDQYKPILLSKPDDPEHGKKTHRESLYIRELVMNRLKEMIYQRQEAPDFLISTMAPTKERMEPAGEGGAKVNLYIITCPLEGPDGAIWRAWNRAKDEKNAEDFNRFMTVKEILESHYKSSKMLPVSLAERRRDLRLFNTASRPTVLAASMDGYNRELRIFDPQALVTFVRKSFVLVESGSEKEMYPPDLTDRKLASEMCEYLNTKIKVSFNFRYSVQWPNPMRNAIRKLRLPNEQKEIRQMMLDSQPETYMWAGHGRAVVRDFDTFVKALGEGLATALLIELGSRWPLIVRNYIGNVLFEVDIKRKKVLNYSDKLQDLRLRPILDSVASVLENEINHDQQRVNIQP